MLNFAKGTKLGLRLPLRGIITQVEDMKGVIKMIRECLRDIQDTWNQQDILRGVWRKFEYTFEEAGTFTVKHNMPFVPCDFIFTGNFGGITATIDNNTVTDTEMDIVVSGPGKIRMVIGNITDFDTR